MIEPSDLTGVEESLARRVITAARSFAPCIHALDGEAKKDAVAILQGVAEEAKARGARFVANQGVGSARVSYTSSRSWFTPDDRDGLRTLCPSAGDSEHAKGRFPRPHKPLVHMWPEEY